MAFNIFVANNNADIALQNRLGLAALNLWRTGAAKNGVPTLQNLVMTK